MAEDDPIMDVAEEGEEGEEAAPAVEEELELNEESALRGVLRKALVHDGLQRGLHESAKALDRHSAKLCVLARDVDSDEYKTLVTALCKEGSVPLLYIDTREKLGEFVGLAKVDKEGNPRGKIQKCSVAVVTDFGEESREYHKLQEFIAKVQE
ncbi:ribosomal protein partial [Nannochloropsis oceanica]